MITHSRRAARLGALAIATLPVLALAGGAWAEDVSLAVGDLSRPDQAAAFARGLDAAEMHICSNVALSAQREMIVRNCAASVHDEAMIQLKPAQRAAFAAFEERDMRLAGGPAARP